jgi:hypothetical protein
MQGLKQLANAVELNLSQTAMTLNTAAVLADHVFG